MVWPRAASSLMVWPRAESLMAWPCAANQKKSAEMKKHFDRILNLAEEKAGEPSASRPGRGKLRVGSDCAGMGSDLAGLTLFGFREQIETSMWSDNDPDKRKLYRHVCSLLDLDVSPVCKDMSKRNAVTAPSCDVYVAG